MNLNDVFSATRRWITNLPPVGVEVGQVWRMEWGNPFDRHWCEHCIIEIRGCYCKCELTVDGVKAKEPVVDTLDNVRLFATLKKPECGKETA